MVGSQRHFGRSAEWMSSGLIMLVLVALIAALMTNAARAATPGSGSLSTATPTVTYTSGPFAVANVSGAAGAVQCGTATPCDDFGLQVSVPAGYDATNSISVKIQWANSSADFDLYVLDASGTVIKSSASSSDPEATLIPAVSGTYTVRIVPFAPLGQSVTGTISLVAKPTPPPPSTVTAPQYQNFVTPNTLPGYDQAGEPSIGADWQTGRAMYQAYTHTFRVTFNDAVSPATAVWADKSPTTSVTSLDPILFTDPQTGRTFVSQLAGKVSLSSFSDNDGTTWTPNQGAGPNSGVDHQSYGGGPFAPGPIGPLGSYPNAVYYCSQDIADASCSLSRDGGLTYGPSVPMYSTLDCGGLHGHVKVAPDGTVYVPNKSCGGNQAVAVSRDNGTMWSVLKVPSSLPGDSDPSVGIGAANSVYFGYQNGDGHPHVAVSHDHGQTWVNDQDVGTTFGLHNVVFPTVVAGDDNRAAFAFLGTPTGGNYQDAANFHGVWHLYVAHTYDGGKSWVTSDATPNDPVQRGSICTGGTTCGKDRNLLDFMDITKDQRGRVLVGYADGCVGTCVQSEPNSFTQIGTIARESNGLGLFAQYDPQPDLIVSNIVASQPKPGQTVLTATVVNIGAANATGVVVRLLNGTTTLGDTAAVNLVPGASQQVSITWNMKGIHGSKVITAVADPNNMIAESNEGNNKLQRTVTIP